MNPIQVGAVDPSTPSSELRRTPKQERSRALVTRVLDATDGLLADGEDPGSLTTTKIARAAGVSVGAVYQYFTEAESIVAAVAARHIAASTALIEEALADLAADPDPVGTLVELFAARYRAEPGYRALWFGPHLNASMQAADRAGKEAIAATVRRAFSTPDGNAPEIPEDASRAAVFAVDSLLQEAFRRDPSGDQGLLEQAKLMMRAYLAEVAPRSTKGGRDGH